MKFVKETVNDCIKQINILASLSASDSELRMYKQLAMVEQKIFEFAYTLINEITNKRGAARRAKDHEKTLHATAQLATITADLCESQSEESHPSSKWTWEEFLKAFQPFKFTMLIAADTSDDLKTLSSEINTAVQQLKIKKDQIETGNSTIISETMLKEAEEIKQTEETKRKIIQDALENPNFWDSEKIGGIFLLEKVKESLQSEGIYATLNIGKEEIQKLYIKLNIEKIRNKIEKQQKNVTLSPRSEQLVSKPKFNQRAQIMPYTSSITISTNPATTFQNRYREEKRVEEEEKRYTLFGNLKK